MPAHRWAPRVFAAVAVGAVAVALLWDAPAAVADTTVIGEQNLVPNAANIDQLGQDIPVFQGDASEGYVLSSPRAGTITSWSFLSGGVATGKQFELAVLASTDQTGTGWSLIATSAPVAIATATGTDAVNGPFPAQIPIDVGQRIALLPVDDTNTPIETGTPNVDGIRFFAQPFTAIGTSQDIVSGADSGQVVPIQATVAFTGPPLPPLNTTPPTVTGTARQFEILTGDPGQWQGGVDTFTYTWFYCAPDGTNCVAVPQSNSTKYTLARSDVGFAMRFQVVASNGGGASQPALSLPTAVVQPGVVTAKLAVSPSPSCTGVPTGFTASGSVSPDGIKSYSFQFIDLRAAIEQDAVDHPESPIVDEIAAEDRERLYTSILGLPDGGAAVDPAQLLGLHDGPYLAEHFPGPTVVTADKSISQIFNWDRAAISNPNAPYLSLPPGTLARDDLGVLLVVTDNAGHTARAFAGLEFAQFLSSDSRAACNKSQRPRFLSGSVLAARVLFRGGQLSTTARCRSRVACVGTVTVVTRGRIPRAAAPADVTPRVLASGFFDIPSHHRGKISLQRTPLGESLLQPGARVPVTVTVSSTSPSGHSVKRKFREVLKPRPS